MHHNSQKKIYGEQIYFITCDVEDSVNYFENEIICELWLKEIKLAKTLFKFKLYAFCLNYDHFHLLIQPDDSLGNYSKIMQFLKRNFSQNSNKILGYTPSQSEGDNAHCRLQ